MILDTSKYGDPFNDVWHARHRYTVSFLRRRGIDAAVRFVPVLGGDAPPGGVTPLAVYFEVPDDTVTPALGFLAAWRRSLPETRFLLGGALGSQVAGGILDRHLQIDGVLVGDCEETLAEIGTRLRAGQPITNIPGLRTRDADLRPRAPIENLDDLGMMVRDGLAELYQQSPPAERVGYLLAGRGCYADCSFCAVPTPVRQRSPGPSLVRQPSPSPRWRGRSVPLVVEEMDAIAKEFGVRRFVFQDDNFFGPGLAGQDRARQFARAILNRRLVVEYFVTCRINDVDADTLRVMKESGLTRLGIGVESMNQRSLSLFRKGYRADAIYPALEVIDEVGISCEVNLIFFEPLMSLADVRRNLDFLEFVARHDRFSYSDAFPFRTLLVMPGAPIAGRLAERGALGADGTTCRFRDPGVAALAEFADRLRDCLPVVFKQRSLIATRSGLRAAEGVTGSVREIAIITARLREWLGLVVLPRYLRAACDLVERCPGESRSGLIELAASFDGEMAVLRRLGRRLQEVVAERIGTFR